MDAPEIQRLTALLRKVIATAGQAASFLHRKQKIDDLCLNDVSDAFQNVMAQVNTLLPKPVVLPKPPKPRKPRNSRDPDKTETTPDDNTGADSTAN